MKHVVILILGDTMVECFFFVEKNEENESKSKVRALCVDCKNENSWFYQGEVGPWNIICHICGKVIHHYEDKENTTPI